MWEVPRYRIKAYLRQLRKERSNYDRAPKAHFHFLKVRGQIAVTEGFGRTPGIIGVSIVLNDLNYSGVWLFSSQPLIPGQSVRLTLQHPSEFFVSGVVTSSTRVLNSFSVISPQSSFPYRVHIRFNARNTNELVDIRKFIHRIQSQLYPSGNA